MAECSAKGFGCRGVQHACRNATRRHSRSCIRATFGDFESDRTYSPHSRRSSASNAATRTSAFSERLSALSALDSAARRPIRSSSRLRSQLSTAGPQKRRSPSVHHNSGFSVSLRARVRLPCGILGFQVVHFLQILCAVLSDGISPPHPVMPWPG